TDTGSTEFYPNIIVGMVIFVYQTCVEENLKETPDPFVGVFRSKALQDSLDKFIVESRKMKSSDTVHFPLYDTVVYSARRTLSASKQIQ
ncbi:MAG: hypothetical protein K2J00_07325, partial [Bacteroidaceae bacterium]|nr:hypothetical protein [Bacteroidaceae bacterium]